MQRAATSFGGSCGNSRDVETEFPDRGDARTRWASGRVAGTGVAAPPAATRARR